MWDNKRVLNTIWEVWVAQLQVFAGACRVTLCAQGVFHLLNLQFQRVERAEYLLHAVLVVLVVGICRFVHHLAGIDVSLCPFWAGLHGQRVDDITWRTLEEKTFVSIHMTGLKKFEQYTDQLTVQATTIFVWLLGCWLAVAKVFLCNQNLQCLFFEPTLLFFS